MTPTTAEKKAAQVAYDRELAEAITVGVKPPGTQPVSIELGRDRVRQFAYRQAVKREHPEIPNSTGHSHKPNIVWMLIRQQKGNSANVQCWPSGKVMFTGCEPVSVDAITEADWEFAKVAVAGIEAGQAAQDAAREAELAAS